MRKMKKTGIEWCSEIPDNWATIRFKDRYVNKKDIAGESSSVYERLALTLGGVIKRPKDDSEGLQPKAFDSYQILRSGDFVFKMIDLQNVSTSRVGLSPYTGLVSPAYIRFSPKEEDQYSRFVYHYLMSMYYNCVFNSLGGDGVRSSLNATDMGAIMIPYPNIEEQKKIADYIDSTIKIIDSLIANEEKQIEKLREYKQSLITEVVTKGLDPDAPMKDSGVEWIGDIPQGWSIFRIADLYFERSEKGLEDLPILTVSINTGITDYEMTDEERSRIVNRSEDRTKYKRVYKGDLAYNMMRAWQGAFGAVRVDGMVSPAYVVAKPKGMVMIDSRYIEALLRTPSAIEEMHRYSRGIMDFRLRLYWPEFRAINVCVPPYEMQKDIADYIDALDIKINRLIDIKQKKIDNLNQYKKSLIYEYVTGRKEVN